MSSARERVVIALVAGSLLSGCPSPAVALRPDGSPGPQMCPEQALYTMRIMHLRPGDSADADVDTSQADQTPISLNDGPVESMLLERLGFFGAGSTLYGQVWTGGPNVVIRYYEARPLDGERVKICAVARLAFGNMRKLPGSKPGNALLEFSKTSIVIVDEFL
jgi:hypothetical protein